MLTILRKITASATLVAALAVSHSTSVAAQPLFDGCPSDEIMSRFVEFGKTGKMPQDLGQWLSNPVSQYIDPWKPFDNVDFVGICWVSAWLVHTDEGTVLIDTLYGPFQELIVENIKRTGTDLADIKYVLMTHGHFDHAGGASTLKPLLPNATFVMTQAGWDEAIESSEASQGGRRAWDMIARDKVVADGDDISLGGNTFTVIETPGHTWGTASYLYNVNDGENIYRSITIGGLGLNAIEGPSQVEAFIASLDHVSLLVTNPDNNVQVHLTTHGFSNNLEEDREELMSREPGAPNVFVDSEGLLEQISSLRAGAVERLEIEKNK